MQHDTVHADFEEIRDLRRGQHRRAVRTRRDHGGPQPARADRARQRHRAGIRIDADGANRLRHHLVLPVAEPAHRLAVHGIAQVALRERDPARLQEIPNAVVARLAIDVEPVVRIDVEGAKRLAGRRRAPLEERVEHLLPARRVYACSVRDDAVEIEEHRIEMIGGEGGMRCGHSAPSEQPGIQPAEPLAALRVVAKWCGRTAPP